MSDQAALGILTMKTNVRISVEIVTNSVIYNKVLTDGCGYTEFYHLSKFSELNFRTDLYLELVHSLFR